MFIFVSVNDQTIKIANLLCHRWASKDTGRAFEDRTSAWDSWGWIRHPRDWSKVSEASSILTKPVWQFGLQKRSIPVQALSAEAVVLLPVQALPAAALIPVQALAAAAAVDYYWMAVIMLTVDY